MARARRAQAPVLQQRLGKGALSVQQDLVTQKGSYDMMHQQAQATEKYALGHKVTMHLERNFGGDV